MCKNNEKNLKEFNNVLKKFIYEKKFEEFTQGQSQ